MFQDPNSTSNPATGAVITSAWGDKIRDDLMALYGPPRVRAHLAGPKSIAASTLTAVQFDTELQDTHTMHSTSSNTTRLTVPTNWGGDWLWFATVQWEPNTSGNWRHCEIDVNAALKLVDDVTVPAAAGGYATQNLLALWPGMGAGDYVELYVKHDAGGPLNIQADGYAGTVFEGYFVGNGAG